MTIDFRPIAHVIGFLVMIIGFAMLIPFAIDLHDGTAHAQSFAQASLIAIAAGAGTSLATRNAKTKELSLQQLFLLTTLVWVMLPIVAALPFWLGGTLQSYTDAFFEAMSALTTTGSTVYAEIESLPRGVLLWRALMQWFGGVGIIVVAMVFLPVLRIGGMQIFRSEAFDTMGKVLPRAAEISAQISTIYLSLTLLCILGYLASGMPLFDAFCHAFTTISTGGLSTRNDSMASYGTAVHLVAVFFMILASLPFVRFVQLLDGQARPLLRDTQIRSFFVTIAAIVIVLSLYNIVIHGREEALWSEIEVLFNITSIITGTGYGSADYQLWGAFPIVVFFFTGLIGGCAGSTCCSIKIFRFQLLFAAISARIRSLFTPNAVINVTYQGARVDEATLSSVMGFFMMFLVSLVVLSTALSMTGLDMITSVSGAATALANIGPGLGSEIGPTGNFATLNDAAKWLLSAGMLLGRLELMVVFVLFTAQFWRD